MYHNHTHTHNPYEIDPQCPADYARADVFAGRARTNEAEEAAFVPTTLHPS